MTQELKGPHGRSLNVRDNKGALSVGPGGDAAGQLVHMDLTPDQLAYAQTVLGSTEDEIRYLAAFTLYLGVQFTPRGLNEVSDRLKAAWMACSFDSPNADGVTAKPTGWQHNHPWPPELVGEDPDAQPRGHAAPDSPRLAE